MATQRPYRRKRWTLSALAAALIGGSWCLLAVFPDTGAPRLSLITPALADDDDDGGGGGGGGGGGPGGGAAPGGGGEGGWRGPAHGARVTWPWSASRPARPAPAELVALVPGTVDRRRLEDAGFTVVEETAVATPPGRLMRLRAPARLSTEAGLERLRGLGPGIVADRNHRYRTRYRKASAAAAAGGAAPLLDPFSFMRWPAEAACRSPATIAMLDTGVELNHADLRDPRVTVLRIGDPSRPPSSTEHGTSIATILLRGLGQGTAGRLIAIDVFHRRSGGEEARAFDLARGLDTARASGASVVNVSVAGPDNMVLDAAGSAARQAGIVIVAAAGNDGPAARPLYPAAYPWAIAVTAVDGRGQVYRRANRGPHIDYAAPGVALPLPAVNGRQQFLSGTSFAAPFIAAALAGFGHRLPAGDGTDATSLAGISRDLGAPGRDDVFGWGLPQLDRLCTEAATAPE